MAALLSWGTLSALEFVQNFPLQLVTDMPISKHRSCPFNFYYYYHFKVNY